MKYDYRNIDFMVLLPCPMKAAFGKKANLIYREMKEKINPDLNFLPVSAMDTEIIRELMSIKDPDDFPAVMMMPGFSFPYAENFRKRFRDTGAFESIMPHDNETFLKYGLYDPKGIYDIVGITVSGFYSDLSYHPELKPPMSWKELLFDPAYHRMVGLPGRETVGFQAGPMLAAYILYGMEGVMNLAKTAVSCLIPAEMVRMAGSRSDIAPAVGIMNYNMAMAAGHKNSHTQFIWPEEGLFASPITMLTRKSAPEKARMLARKLMSEDTAGCFRIGGFYAAADKEPLGQGRIFTCSWDFIESHDVPALSQKLAETVYANSDIVFAGEVLKEECSV